MNALLKDCNLLTALRDGVDTNNYFPTLMLYKNGMIKLPISGKAYKVITYALMDG